MKIITIKSYETCSRSRWGWHTFRDGKDYKGKITGFRFLGIGLCWRKSSNWLSSFACLVAGGWALLERRNWM